MGIYVLQISKANHWGRPTNIRLIGPFANEFWDLTSSPPEGTYGGRDQKIAEANARRWMDHPYHAQYGVLRSTVVELDEPTIGVQKPRAIW